MNRGSLDSEWMAPARFLGFNEAPIHESGKSDSPRLADCAASWASMRPRFMNRGSSAVQWQSSECPPCFNEAPIHESGKLCGCRSARR